METGECTRMGPIIILDNQRSNQFPKGSMCAWRRISVASLWNRLSSMHRLSDEKHLVNCA